MSFFSDVHIINSGGYRTKLECGTILLYRLNKRSNTRRLNSSFRITKKTGMPGNRGLNAFDMILYYTSKMRKCGIPMYHNFQHEKVSELADYNRNRRLLITVVGITSTLQLQEGHLCYHLGFLVCRKVVWFIIIFVYTVQRSQTASVKHTGQQTMATAIAI